MRTLKTRLYNENMKSINRASYKLIISLLRYNIARNILLQTWSSQAEEVPQPFKRSQPNNTALKLFSCSDLSSESFRACAVLTSGLDVVDSHKLRSHYYSLKVRLTILVWQWYKKCIYFCNVKLITPNFCVTVGSLSHSTP